MKIVVTVKQVPEADKVAVNPETGTLIREGIESILNPFCEYALDMAVKIRDDNPENEVEIIAISMGPPQAKLALLRCLELGADRAILLSDRAFAGSDVWATALTLKEGIRKVLPEFDLILCGKQAIDGDTAQVPAELAENLGIPQIFYGIDVKLENKKLIVKKETDSGFQIIQTRLPALVSISKGPLNIRRLSSMKNVIEARSKPLKCITAEKLDIDKEKLGLNGSYTQVIRVFAPPEKKTGFIIDGSNPSKAAEQMLAFLKEHQLIKYEGE
ncbi:MAG: electron transfer flavoprotein subunit beta/FixA family protein [Promethearchaeota archaeon]|jgi:electron transfer flavoprotein beta subunit